MFFEPAPMLLVYTLSVLFMLLMGHATYRLEGNPFGGGFLTDIWAVLYLLLAGLLYGWLMTLIEGFYTYGFLGIVTVFVLALVITSRVRNEYPMRLVGMTCVFNEVLVGYAITYLILFKVGYLGLLLTLASLLITGWVQYLTFALKREN